MANREIKFRAWNKKEKVFIECGLGMTFGSDFKNQIFQQFTGLKDKNGKDIYEGDIMGYFDKRKKRILLIEYLMHRCEEYGDLMGFKFNETMEVIGNIYENPELFALNKNVVPIK